MNIDGMGTKTNLSFAGLFRAHRSLWLVGIILIGGG